MLLAAPRRLVEVTFWCLATVVRESVVDSQRVQGDEVVDEKLEQLRVVVRRTYGTAFMMLRPSGSAD